MRKLLLLFFALLTGVSGAWAVTLEFDGITSSNGTFSNVSSASENYKDKWVSKITETNTIALTIQSYYNDMYALGSVFYAPKTGTNSGVDRYQLSVPEGYVITGYSFTAGYKNLSATLTPEMGAAAKTVSSETTSATITVSNICSTTTYFEITGSSASAATGIDVSNFTVTVEEAVHGLSDGIYTITYTSGYGSHYMTATAGLGAYGSYAAGTDAGIFQVSYSSATGNYTIKELNSNKFVGAKESILNTVSTSTPYSGGNYAALELVTSSTDYKSRWALEATSDYYRVHPAGMTKTSIAVYSGGNKYFSFHDQTSGYDHARASFATPTLTQLINNKIDFATIASCGYTIEQICAQLITNNTPSQTGAIGWPSSTGWTTFQSTVNAFTTSNTYDDLTSAINALWATVIYPSDGYYYIKGKAYSNYMLYDEYLTNFGYAALLNDETTPKQLWKVAANGYTPSVTSSIGKPIANNSSSYNPITLSCAYVNGYSNAYGYFYFNNFHSPNFSTQADVYAYNTAAAYSNSNPMRAISYENVKGDGNYWTFVDASGDYDIYDVVIVDPLGLVPTLTCTLDGYNGNTLVYNGGFYAFAKDTEISTSNFEVQSDGLDGYDTSATTISIEGNTITVTYSPAKTYTELAEEFFTDHDIAAKLGASYSGTIGYPKTTSTGYTNLYGIASKASFTEEDYTNLLAYYSAYLAETNVNLPVEGKTYTFVNFHKDGTTKKYLYNNSGTLAVATLAGDVPSSGYFVAHEGLDGKYFFVAKGSNSHFVIARSNSGKADMTNGYSTTYSPIELVKMPSDVTNTSNGTYSYSVDGEAVFGGFYLKGMRTDDQANGIIIVAKASNAFDAFHTFPVFHDNFSTAFLITEVDVATETYYNTVNMHKAGDHSYASTYLPLAVQLPENVKAYKASAPVDNVMRMTKVADGNDPSNNVLPALTPAILWSENAAVTGNQILTFVSSAVSAPGDNALRGTLADNTTVSATTYVLSGDASSVGFYPLEDTTAPTCKAYYDAGAYSVKSFSFSFEDIADGIESIHNSDCIMHNYYDLSGRRVEKPTRGVYVVNGKKVVIK